MKSPEISLENTRQRQDIYLILASLASLIKLSKGGDLQPITQMLETAMEAISQFICDSSQSIYHGSTVYEAEHYRLAQEVHFALSMMRLNPKEAVAMAEALQLLSTMESDEKEMLVIH